MSILIKGMEMPTNCCQCPVNMEVCKRGYKYLLKHPELYDKRADDCPLITVPPHGRLIDADAFAKDLREDADSDWNKNASPISWSDAWTEVADTIDELPTIIEADKDGAE